MKRQDHFAAVASQRIVRPAVRAVVRSDRGFLVQRNAEEIGSHYAFIGGEYELGDTFDDRLRKEFEEETCARVVSAEYLFVVENRFFVKEGLVQTLEHYFDVVLDRADVVSREAHLEQVWLPRVHFAVADVRPAVVRDALLTPGWAGIRRLCVTI